MGKGLDTLTIAFFRGASQSCEIKFDAAKPLVMVFGENGSGKSTIADAIDFIGNGVVGSLEDRSTGGNRVHFLPTVGHKPQDVRIQASAGGVTWTGTISSSRPQVTGSPPTLRARVLRRSRLLRFVEAKPAERYDELRAFIDVDGVERSEQALRDAAREMKRSADGAAEVLQDAQQALEALWQEEGFPAPGWEAWAKQKSEADQQALQERAGKLTAAQSDLEALKARGRDLRAADDALAERRAELAAAHARAGALPPISGMQAVELIGLLQEAEAIVLKTADLTACPVCEQSIVRNELQASLQHRREEIAEHQVVADAQRRATSAVAAAEVRRQSALNEFVEAARRAAVSFEAAGRQVDTSALSAGAQSLLKGEGAPTLEDAREVYKLLEQSAPTLQEDQKTAQADLSQYNAIKTQYQRILANRDRAREFTEMARRLKDSLDVCESTRREYTDEILASIEGDLNDLYSKLHPGEPLGPIRLSMNPNQRGSVNQSTSFEGHDDVPPQAYFSDSHLDTLGFCVWLALARRDHPEETVLVLDDILTSVDSVHLTRFTSLLNEVADEFAQVLVLTHYRTWRDRYRLAQSAAGKVQLLELHSWTLERGLQLTRAKLVIEDLEAALESTPLDRHRVASLSGILLEAVLDRLTVQYRLRLPRTPDGRYTLGELIDACRKLFGKLEVERSALGTLAAAPAAAVTAMQPFLDDAGALAFIRNQVGAHFNLDGSEIADHDVEDFGRAAVALARALACDKCDDMADKRDGTHFRCGCNRTRMTPLEHR